MLHDGFLALGITFFFRRFFCPSDVLLNWQEGELRLGGWRDFQFLNSSAFQLLLACGERVIIGVSVEAHYDAPYIKECLDDPLYQQHYADPTIPDSQRNQRKLNIARWAMCQALTNRIRTIDTACVTTPNLHSPEPDNSSQVLIRGRCCVLDTEPFQRWFYACFTRNKNLSM